jgi:hypothetical protein
MDKEQHVAGDLAAQREHFRGEEVGPGENVHMGAEQRLPRRGALALWGRGNAVATENVSHRLIR